MNIYDKGERMEGSFEDTNSTIESSGYDNSPFIENDTICYEGDISENDDGYDQSVFEE